ncbi:hypothetical protein SRB17_10810 [Streptomyces sp. RB17]|nr:hypothetical protein [Streptomyces sp. RB17]
MDHTIKPLAMRVYFIAVAEMNRIGHAEFAPGALGSALGTVDARTGEMAPVHPVTLSKAIKQAKGWGLISEDSSARCLVIPAYAAQKGSNGTGFCRHHGVRVRDLSPVPTE